MTTRSRGTIALAVLSIAALSIVVMWVAGIGWFGRKDHPMAGRVVDTNATGIAPRSRSAGADPSVGEVPMERAGEPVAASSQNILGVIPPVDAVRFDASAWPALPSDDAPIRESVASMIERAEQGDAGAACWLGVKLRECNVALTAEPTLNAMTEQSKGGTRITADHLLQLEQHADLVDAQLLCQGLPESVHSRGLEFMRQAALAGSRAAIAEMAGINGMSEAGFPDAATVRRTLEDHEALVWAGVVAGIPESIRELALKAEPFVPDPMSAPNRRALSRDDLLTAKLLLIEISEAIVRKQPELAMTPADQLEMEQIKVGLSKLPAARRERVSAVVKALNVSQWRNFEPDDEGANRFKSAQSSCAEFGDPVDVTVSIKDVVGP